MNRPLPIVVGGRLPTWLLDYGPIAVLLLIGGASIVFAPHVSAREVLLLTAALLVILGALLVRHRAPLLALAIVLAVALAVRYGGVVTLPTLFAVFTVAEYRDRRTVLSAAIVTAGVLILTDFGQGRPEAVPALVSRLVAVGLAVSFGLYLRARADYMVGLQERAERLERERELLALQAVGEERVRIARELHDVVAHNVSLMVVQAQALAAGSPEIAEQGAALGRLAELGREALSEMHRMLGVLRLEEPGQAEREPQPGVRGLPALVHRADGAGLACAFTVEGEPRELPPGVDLSAYRIVQEALTNVIRHAGARQVEVRLQYAPDAVAVSIVDDGRGPASTNGSSGGHGLVGMRERVALFGGRLEAGARPDAPGYRVHATLPTR